jgi:hypothetical protein
MTALSAVRKYTFVLLPFAQYNKEITSNALSVAHYGLGRDIWTLPFDNITEVLYVRGPTQWL